MANAKQTEEKRIFIDADDVAAVYCHGTLTIRASGREDGVRNIQIAQALMPIEPPVFTLTGERSAAIGDFPYEVSANFKMGSPPPKVTLQTASGPRTVAVMACLESDAAKSLPASFTKPEGDGEVVTTTEPPRDSQK